MPYTYPLTPSHRERDELIDTWLRASTWRDLREFTEDKTRDDVAALQLSNFVPGMIGKKVFVAIGKTDERVSTAKCQAFVEALKKSNSAANRPADTVEFHMTDDPGHSLGDAWYEKGRAFLLDSVTGVSP